MNRSGGRFKTARQWLFGWIRRFMVRNPSPARTLVLISGPRPMGLEERGWSREDFLRRIPELRPYLGPYGRPYRPMAEYLALSHGVDRSLATLARLDGQEPWTLAQLAEWPRLLIHPANWDPQGNRVRDRLN